MFQLESLTKAKVLDVRVLSSKDRKPDEPPGAQLLLLQATLSSDVLAMFDGFLPAMLYRKPSTKTQGELEGMEGAELTPIGDHVKRLKWQYEQTGCEVEIDLGLGGKSNLVLSDCKVHRVSISPRQGGSVVVQWSVDAPGLSDTTRGKLTGLKSTEIDMLMLGPVPDGQQQIAEDKKDNPAATTPATKAAPKSRRSKSATDEFIDAHTTH